MNSKATFVLLLLLVSSLANAGPFLGTFRQALDRAYIPEGFDSNDNVEFVASGRFKNSCYQISQSEASPPKKVPGGRAKILLSLRVNLYEGQECVEGQTPFYQTFRVGLLPVGDYSLIDSVSGRELGQFSVTEAPDSAAGADNINYVPLQDAFIFEKSGQRFLMLKGIFTDSCMKVGQVDVSVNRDSVVVLPQLKREANTKCEAQTKPFRFEKRFTEQLPGGVFLFHARSMGGQAITKLSSELTIDGL